jgi:hypothetical protein
MYHNSLNISSSYTSSDASTTRVGVEVGCLDWRVNGAAVVLVGDGYPPFEVLPELVRQSYAASLGIACSLYVAKLSKEETGGCKDKLEELCLSRESGHLTRG